MTHRRLPNLLARFQGGGVSDVSGIGLALIGFSLRA
jgi:multisubunit Na+/H+ antiporter MnhG subunit